MPHFHDALLPVQVPEPFRTRYSADQTDKAKEPAGRETVVEMAAVPLPLGELVWILVEPRPVGRQELVSAVDELLVVEVVQ